MIDSVMSCLGRQLLDSTYPWRSGDGSVAFTEQRRTLERRPQPWGPAGGGPDLWPGGDDILDKIPALSSQPLIILLYKDQF